MRKNEEEYTEIDLMRLLGALWRRAWIIILAMLVGGGIAFSYAYFFITPLYQSSALMYVNNSSFSVGSTSVSLSDLNASRSLVDVYTVILKTRLTLNEVIERAGLDYTYEELEKMITASSVNSTEIFSITVTDSDPVEAALIANTVVDVLPDKIAEIVDGSSARTVDLAVVPAQKYAPSFTRYALIGILIGLVVSCGVIIVRELFDDQVRDEETLTKAYEISMLAIIPDLLNANAGKGYYRGYRSYAYSAAADKEKRI